MTKEETKQYMRDYMKLYSQTDKGKRVQRAASKKWKEKNRGRVKQSQALYDKKNNRPKHLRYTFGITLTQYQQRLEAQNFKCAICEKEETAKRPTGEKKNLAIDHCHATGKIRGLLCTRCNTALGNFSDSPELLVKAIKYLTGY